MNFSSLDAKCDNCMIGYELSIEYICLFYQNNPTISYSFGTGDRTDKIDSVDDDCTCRSDK